MAEELKQNEADDYVTISNFLQSRLEPNKQHESKQQAEYKSKDDENISIESLIQTEIRPFELGWIEFNCNTDKNEYDSTLKTFKQKITDSLKRVQNGLYILLHLSQPINSYSSTQDITNILISFYQIIDNLSSKTHGLTFDSRIIIIYNKQMYDTLINTHLAKIPKLVTSEIKCIINENGNNSLLNKYKQSVFGGTFDHLHSGHKVLITIACLVASNTLYIGLSIDKLLAKKKYAHMLQPFDKRKQVLLDFISFVKPDLKVTIEPLNDIYGPSIYESIEVLVISKETIKGGNAVNQKRKELNRKELELIVIDFIFSSDNNNNENTKISSTDIRCFDEKYKFLYNQWSRLILQLITREKNDENRKEIDMRFVNEWWYILFNFYQQKQRFYHTLNHIYDLIKKCIKYSNNIENITVILLSIWFHDIVYDSKKYNNELMSIEVFKVFIDHFLNIFGDNKKLDNDMIDRVIYFIDASIKHQINEQYKDDKDLKWFLDLDLSILADQKDDYEMYAQNIRNEYIHVELSEFVQRRVKVMRNILDKNELYFTDVFKQQFEKIARENVLNEINILMQK